MAAPVREWTSRSLPGVMTQFPDQTVGATGRKPPGHKDQYVTALQATCVVIAYVMLGLALLLFVIAFLLGDLVTDVLGVPRAPPDVAFHVTARLVLIVIALAVVGCSTAVAAWRLSRRLVR